MPEKKILTIAVPAYNAAQTLPICLDSLLEPQALSLLDVIVVNDGSRDSTGVVADAYARRFPGSFQVIHQENGGHGSGINAAVKLAKGKYFKVLDADDRLVTANLSALLRALDAASADVVVTPFWTVSPGDTPLREFPLVGVVSDQEYAFADFWKAKRGAKLCCTVQGISYRTDFYRACHIRLSEGIFYEDWEFSTLPFRQVHTLLPLNLSLYRYTIGSAAQSISPINQIKNLPHLEKVFWVLWETYRELGDAVVRNYFRFKMAELLLNYFTASLLVNSDRKTGRRQARALWRRVRKQDRELAYFAAKRYYLVTALHYAGICGVRWDALRQAPGYRYLRRLAY